MTPEKTTLAVRVLTLATAQDRQEQMRKTIEGAWGLRGVPWRFHHAVPFDGSTLAYDDAAAYAAGRTLSAAELSCFVSHLGIISSWLEEGVSDVLLVLEDDVHLDPWFDFQAAARLAQSAGLDYLRLYSRVWMPARQIVYHGRVQVVRFTWSPSGTQAFLLTRQGAKRIVDAVAAQGRIVRPVDDLIDRYWEVGNPVYGLFPSPVIEHNMSTTIHNSEAVRARRQRQAEIEKARRSVGLSGTLRSRSAALLDRFARRKHEKALRRTDPEVAARVLSVLTAPGFRYFKADPPAAPPGAAPEADRPAAPAGTVGAARPSP